MEENVQQSQEEGQRALGHETEADLYGRRAHRGLYEINQGREEDDLHQEEGA